MRFFRASSETRDKRREKIKEAAFCYFASLELHDIQQHMSLLDGNTACDLVTKEEMVASFVYKMDRLWLQAGELRVEIHGGHALWVIGQGDETVKVKLRRNHKMKVSEATASMSTDGVLTIVIPKKHLSRKWYEYMDLALLGFQTVHVSVSSS